MKRALTGIAAAAVVLGTAAPMAFAATSSGLTKAGQLPIVVNGSVLSNPYEMTGKDSGNTTAYFPVYYFDQALTKIGYTATWDGVTHTWAITAPGVDASTVASSIAGGVGTGNTTITVNGTVVKKINTKAAKDPAASKSAAATTYFPAYYIDEIFNSLGANVSFSGQTGLKITGGANATAPSLGSISFSGQSMGTGTSSSPAAETDGNVVNASTTLTDENGNPVGGINVTFDIVDLANSGVAPTVTSGGLNLVADSGSGTSSDPWKYTAQTNSSGVATIGLSASTGSYSVEGVAPYSANGVQVTSSTGYVQFGQAGSLLISPVTDNIGFSTSSSEAGLVPVTVTVIPTVAGSSASNIPVDFSFTTNSGSPYIASSSGGYLQPIGSTQVYTDANGQATVYVNATAQASLSVSASAEPNGVSENSATSTITWQQSGTPSKIVNTPTSTVSSNINTNVTISGTVEDSMGNPVPNAQLLVSGSDDGNGDLDYVSGSTSTEFPNVGTSLSGAYASSSFGQMVTAGSNGAFSVTVNDSNAEDATVQVWSVQNGQITSVGDLNNGALAQYSLKFEQNSTTLSAVYVDSTIGGLVSGNADDGYTANDEDTSTSWAGQEGSSDVSSPVYVGAFAGKTPYGPANSTVQYTISGNNNGYVNAVDGVLLNGGGLPNQPATALVNVSYDSDGAVSQVTVDGVPISSNANYKPAGNGAALTFVPGSGSVENDTFTVSTGGQKATVSADFSAGQPAELSNAGSATVSSGQTAQVSFTIEDSNGNPIPYGTVQIKPSGVDNLWITAVNGQSLVQNVYSSTMNYGSQETPVPLFTPDTSLNLDPSVIVSGALSATQVGTADQTITLYGDENGKVQLSLTAGGNQYWDTATTEETGATPAGNGNHAYFSYDSDGNLVISNNPPTSNSIGSLTY